MSQPDDPPIASFVQEEMMNALNEMAGRIMVRLPPITRLRLLAFMHLIEKPEAMKASLDIEPAGCLRLTLAADCAAEDIQLL
jgi:hypothetical protein